MVSVIIPIFNSDRWIQNTLNDICNMSCKNIEIILIDDGSEDNSLNICREFQRGDNRIKVFSNKNRGVSYSRNYGIDKASGEYIVFFDSDDRINRDCIEKLLEVIKKNESDMAVCNYKYKDEVGNVLRYESDCKSREYNEKEAIIEALTKEYFGGYLWNKMFVKSNIIKNNIRFNEDISIFEDLLFVIDYIKCCKKINYINYIGYEYIKHQDSAITLINDKKEWSKIIAMERIEKSLFEYRDNEINKIIRRRKINSKIDFIRIISKIDISLDEINIKKKIKYIEEDVRENIFNYFNFKRSKGEIIRILSVRIIGINNIIKIERKIRCLQKKVEK